MKRMGSISGSDGERRHELTQIKEVSRDGEAPPSVAARNEAPALDWRLVVVLPMVRALRQLHLGSDFFLYGIDFRMCEMQFRRARRLSSERAICHGAYLLSVASSMRSRAREKSYQRR